MPSEFPRHPLPGETCYFLAWLLTMFSKPQFATLFTLFSRPGPEYWQLENKRKTEGALKAMLFALHSCLYYDSFQRSFRQSCKNSTKKIHIFTQIPE